MNFTDNDHVAMNIYNSAILVCLVYHLCSQTLQVSH